MLFLDIVQLQAVLIILMAIGFFCKKAGMLDDKVRGGLTALCMDVIIPCNLINMSLRQHRDAGMPGLMRHVIKAKAFHKRRPVTVKVVSVGKVLMIRCVQQILAVRTLIPSPIHWQHLVCNWNSSDPVLCFTGNHIEVSGKL